MGHKEHEKLARQKLNIALVTFSDTRTEENDHSGNCLKNELTAAGHRIVFYKIEKENPDSMQTCIDGLIKDEKLDVVITNGGTGISTRDNTIEVIAPLFEKTIDGFGEIFRLVSYQQIGAAAMLSRACAGVVRGKIIICLPGSTKAVKLAARRIVVPQLTHMIWEARR
ncbi:MAG: molybdenum cofactor biosynthesis protein MoaB [Candidatus Rifleibacteriota bacterium]